MEPSAKLANVQGLMVFLASMAKGLEDILGRGAGAITYRAGRTSGRKAAADSAQRDDLLDALDGVWEEMCRLGMRWHFAPYRPAGQEALIVEEEGKRKVHLVFDNCQVRCALFRHGHPQKLSLCLMNHGLFCGLVEKIHGGQANLDVLHAGENACLKVLTVQR